MGAGLRIGGKAFDNCMELERVSIPNDLNSMGDGAFETTADGQDGTRSPDRSLFRFL